MTGARDVLTKDYDRISPRERSPKKGQTFIRINFKNKSSVTVPAELAPPMLENCPFFPWVNMTGLWYKTFNIRYTYHGVAVIASEQSFNSF